MFLVGIEAILTGIVVGGVKGSWLWGIGAWLLLQGIYFIPYIGSSVTMFTSAFEAMIIYEILNSLNVSSETERFFISLLSFIILVFIHRRFAQKTAQKNGYDNLDDDSQMGYGWLIFESIIIAVFIHYYIDSVTWAIITFVILLVLAFIPKVRVIEYIVLSVWTGLIVYEEFNNIVTNKYAIIGAICISVFSAIMYMLAFEKLDYKGYKKAKEERKKLEEELISSEMLKAKMYKKYPALEKEYYYFYTMVCKNEIEKAEFFDDWMRYLEYLDESDNRISFNDFFDLKKLYRFHFYNRDFAQKNQSAEQEYTNEFNGENEESEDEIKIVYFRGINSSEGLKKRYKELMKMYHPDNQYGDNDVCLIVQREYEYLMKRYEK